MPTSVYFTVDTECTEERLVKGRVRPPIGYDMMVWGRFANHDRELGLRVILDELERHGFRGTFFVEALCAEFFGPQGLREVCGELRGRGHDIQLHVHPNLRRPEWRHTRERPLSDNIGDYPVAEQVQLLRDGLGHLVACGVPREELLAFRAGTYGASNTTWQALAQTDLIVDSSLNLRYLTAECRILWPTMEIDLFAAPHGVWELPVSNFREAWGYRPLQVTAVSAAEMIYALRRARAAGVEHITIVTHPAEYFAVDSAEYQRGRPNRINQRRLRALISFLAAHPEEFTVSTVGDLARGLRAGTIAAPARRAAIPSGAYHLKGLRLLQQATKRLDTRRGFF